MKKPVDTKYLLVTWREGRRPPGQAKVAHLRHNRRPSNFYLQVGPLEIVWWYR